MPVPCNEYRITIPLNTPDTYWSSGSSTPSVIDWTFINLGKTLKALGINLSGITGFGFVAQLSSSSSSATAHVYFRNYTDDTTILELTTTETSKSNYVATNFVLDKTLLEDEKTFAVYLSLEGGEMFDYAYLGKAYLIVKYRG